MSEPAAAQPPQIVYVQAPAPAPLTPVQQAELDNTAAWRAAGIGCILLLLTFFFAWVIPLLLLVVLFRNSYRMSVARARMDTAVGGETGAAPVSEAALTRWALAIALAGCGVVFLVTAINSVALTGVLASGALAAALIAGGVALQPWRTPLRGES